MGHDLLSYGSCVNEVIGHGSMSYGSWINELLVMSYWAMGHELMSCGS